ncbi:MAG TPA: carboxypeptidase-like regulatory domain-containing protein [Flavobacterium sp.]|uniref:TonB-dependent receptor n=1 Tax=Flavobacterium sp. TaxID=239 RepID=UPI002DBF670A|nr:carboxypeptidase-like regulatory domain-containing protein [Flavobacterium sp.]HEU4791995.1 carboxypeptidase-like regulatory domain-containing protein [Flavobacterium sp.]
MKPILLLFLFCFSNLIAQSKATINGFVKDNFEKKIIGANVSFLTSENLKFDIATDSIGRYSIEIPIGSVRIEVSHVGFVNKSLDLDLKKDVSLSIVLDESNFELKEVVIQNEEKKAMTIALGGKLAFNPQKIGNVPTLTGTPDIIKLLQLTPGVQNSGDGNSYIYVRGGDPGHNLMLYSDATVYGMAHLLGVFPFYNADHIAEVQFDRSNTNSKYGGRLSSTVSVLPYQMAPKDFSIQGNLGLLSSQITFSVPIAERTGFYISGRKTYIDEIVGPLLKSSEGSSNKESEDYRYGFYDSNFTFITEINKKNSLTIDSFLSGDKFRVEDSTTSLNTALKWSNMVISSTWKCLLSDAVTMKNSVFYTRYANNLEMKQADVNIDFSSYIQDLGFSNTIQYYIKNIPFESGFQYTIHDLLPQRFEVSNLGTVASEEETTIHANNAVVFVNLKPKLSDRFSADVGLRLNYYATDSNTSYLHFEPRVMIYYFPKKDLSFFASYTRQNQYINLITASSVGVPTDFWVAASDGIPSQSSDNFSIGSNKVISKQISTCLNGYYRSMKNLTEYPYGLTQFNEITSLKNDILTGDGEAYGLEWMLKKDNERFSGWISYTLSWSVRQFDGLNNGEPFYSKYDRRHNLALVGAYDFNEKWNVGLTQLFSSGNRFTLPTSWYFINNTPVREFDSYNNAQMPNYIRTDVSVNYSFFKTSKKESILNFSVFNMFNISNPIYVVLRVTVDGKKISVNTDEKKLYSILPSISWRFKF